jgi:hypothetical protein
MPATVIPVKGLLLGFVGNISNEGYSLRTARQVNPTDTLVPNFGETVVLNANNTYSTVRQYLLNASTTLLGLSGSTPLALAASNVNINPAYNTVGTNDVLTPGGLYGAGSYMDAMVQGTMNVFCQTGTPTAGGSVWMRLALNAAIPAAVVGGLEAAVDPNPLTTTTISTTINSTAATLSTATGAAVGQTVTSTNVPAGTTIVSLAGTSAVLSNKATATASGTATTLTSNILIPNFLWKTGYLESDLTAQVTVLARTIA